MLNRELTGRSMSPTEFEVSASQLGSIKPATLEQRQAALQYLTRNLELLPPPADWQGEPGDYWLDVFGLNDRPIRVTHRHQSDSVAYPSS